MSRAVIFKLTAVPDESLRQVVTQFGQTVGGIYDAIYKSSSELTGGLTQQLNEQAEVAKQTASEVSTIRTTLDAAQAERESQHTQTIIGELEERVAAARESTDQIAALTELQSAFELQKRADAAAKIAALEEDKVAMAEATADAIKAMNDEIDALEATTGQSVGPEVRQAALMRILAEGKAAVEDIEDDITKAKEKEAARRQKIDKGVVDSALKEAIRERDQKAQLLEQEQRDREEAAHKAAAAAKRVTEANHRVLSAMAEVGESVMRVGRGFVALGLIGEKDLDKVKDALLAIQGVSDLFSGTLQTYFKITRALEAMRDATIAAAAAQKLLSMSQAQNAVASAVASAAGGAAGSARAPVASAVGGVASDVAAGAAGSAIAGSVAGAAGGAAARPSLAKAAGAYAAGAATTAGTVLAGTVLPLAAVGAAGVGLTDLVRGGGRFDSKSMTGRTLAAGAEVGGSWDSYFGLDTVYSRADASRKRTERMEKQRAQVAERTAREDAEIDSLSGAVGQATRTTRAIGDRKLDAETFNAEGPEKVARITKEIADEEARIAELRSKAASQDDRWASLREQLNADALAGEERVLALLGKRRQAEMEIGRQKIQDAQQAVQEAQRELDIAEQKTRVAENAMMSARERFGLLNEEEQQTALESAKRLKAGEALEPEDLRKLQGLGLESVNEAVRSQANTRATAAGFDEIAADDSKRLEELKKSQAELEVTVNDKRQIVVKAEQDTKTIVDNISKQILEKMAENDKNLQAEVDKVWGSVNELRGRVSAGGGRG